MCSIPLCKSVTSRHHNVKLKKTSLPIAVVRPESYTVVLGVQRGTEIIRNNLGFMYYKNKVTENKIYLLCYEKKKEGHFPEVAENYTFLQSVEMMRRLRRKFFPPTPQNMENVHNLLTAADNEHFAITLQNLPNRSVWQSVMAPIKLFQSLLKITPISCFLSKRYSRML
ncbi:hypothetical protein QTP88_024419 [Uroleucon formosanum]